MENFLQSKKAKVIIIIAALILIIIFAVSVINHGGLSLTSDDGEAQTTSDDNKDSSADDKTDSADASDNGKEDLSDIKFEETEEEEGIQAFFIPAEDIYTFSVTDESGAVLSFKRQQSEWIYAGDESVDVDEKQIDKLLSSLCDIYYTDVIDSKDGSEYGLSKSSKRYELADSSGNSTIISVGNAVDGQESKLYFALNYDFTKIYVNNDKLSKITANSIQDFE
ncbi:MAG: DUF4340 domain-containing protein [Pseudobutyrivibrio sp.]|nr:DUF4340 domain-containing protein [Pseudobutyrivibrio sp.]